MNSQIIIQKIGSTDQILASTDESRALQILQKKRSFSNKKTINDPVHSQLFIICQQTNIKKNKIAKLKSERVSRSQRKKNNWQKSDFSQIKNNSNLSFGSQSQLPHIGKKFSCQIKSKTFRSHTQSKERQSLSKKSILSKFTKQQSVLKNNKRFHTLQTKAQYQCHKNNGKINLSKGNTKQTKEHAKIISEWKKIDILKMETYFVKLKNSKYNTIHETLNSQEIDLAPKHNMLPRSQVISEYIKNYKTSNCEVTVESLIKSQNFTVVFENELYLYFGEIRNGLKDGKGIYVCNQYKFQGFWKNDEKIKGNQITMNGCYKGKFKNNKRHGEGQYIWKNGQSYSGQWKSGLKNGSGSWKSGKGDFYIGQWLLGKVQGYGVHTAATGQRYEGYFKQFLKHGQGKQFFPNEDRYQGHYQNGNPEGFGKYVWKNGIFYQGIFKKGFRQGKGMIKGNNYMQFVGIFKKDLPNGQGDLQIQGQSKYIGSFRNGQKNGHGSLNLFRQHKILVGQWSNNQYLFQIPQ